MSIPFLLPFKDNLRHSLRIRKTAAALLYGRARMCGDRLKRWKLYCRAAELGESVHLITKIARRLEKERAFENPEVWRTIVRSIPQVRQQLKSQPALNRSIVLKAPGPDGEKGVLLVYFEYNFAKLFLELTPQELERLAGQYHFILSACWSPTYYAVLVLALNVLKEGFFIQPANRQDEALFRAFHKNLHSTGTMACDWINPERYHPEPVAQRPVDLIMVANWGGFKRHWDFFRALRHLSPALRVVLIGQAEGGRDVGFIRRLAKEIGVPQQIEYHQSLPIEEVVHHLHRAKISLIFSRREGVCVASVESLFAGCALGLRADAHIGPLAYVQEETGVRLRPGFIAKDLQKLIDKAPTLQPARWAKERIAHTVTLARLNEQIKAFDLARKRPWTQALCLPEWRPYPCYTREEDRAAMQPTLDQLARDYPRVFSELARNGHPGSDEINHARARPKACAHESSSPSC